VPGTAQSGAVTIQVPTRRRADTEVDSLRLASLAGVRVAAVLWGGLLLIDLGRMAHAPSYLDLALIALLVAAASLRMRPATALVAALVGWLLVDGFVTHRYGALGYDGTPDAARLALLAVVAVLATRVRR
jgi:hypothetical protein